MSLPLVTVVVPIFNQSRFIVETLDSLVHQSHTNLQIIVVDDGSSDRGAEIVLAKFGEKIELIRQKNLGPSAAINAGLRNARGDFIALNGGDDVSLSNRIALQLEIISATQHDIIFSKPLLINGGGQSIGDKEFPVFFKDRKGSILQDLLLEGNFLCASSAMMHRDVIRKVGLFNAALIQLQDYEYWLRAAAADLSLAEIEPRIVKYRRHKTNLSGHDNGFASSAESLMIIKSILASTSPRAIRIAFPYVFEPTTDLDSPLTQLDRSIFLLAHPTKEIRMAGVEYAASLFTDQEFAKKAERVDFDVFRYSFNSSKS